MGHKVDLQPAGLLVVIPALERAHLYQPLHAALSSGRAAQSIAPMALSDWGKQPVNGGIAHRQHPCRHNLLQLQVGVMLERLHQL